MAEVKKLVISNWLLVTILLLATILRVYKITVIPPSLFGDELDVGYHAYSILKTGRDYSGNFMPLHFQSLAEWRTPLYLYAAVPTVAIWGISPLGVRLPAVIFGVLGIWGIYLLVSELLSYQVNQKKRSQTTDHRSLALIAAGVLALSPWHLQYSRAGFEVTMLLAFLIFGLYFFFRSLKDPRYLWISVAILVFTPWIYSTAKLFTPLLILFLLVIWKKQVLNMTRPHLVRAVVAGLVVGLPVAYSTIFGGGAQRAGYTSVFTDPTIEPEIGTARTVDFLRRGETVLGYEPNIRDRFFHNKLNFWTENITKNYLQTYSSDFLFERGDPNLRHSPKGVGQFYKIEFIALVLGIVIFFTSKTNGKIKLFISFWLVAGALPASLTRDGGNHATRLILILPPLIFLVAFGLVEGISRVKSSYRMLLATSYILLFVLSFVFYLHNYYVHYPWDSERWWHAGFKEAIQSIKEEESEYDRVIISMAGEPAWIFFAGWYMYDPSDWQENFPIGNDVEVEGFGKISHIGKFHFGKFNVEGKSIYDLPAYIDSKTLYLAVAKEVGVNLIQEPDRTPPGLDLQKAIAYPTGEPAYYLFAGESP